MPNLKIQTCLKLILSISLISLISAFFIEYVLEHQPCNLCLIERIPYFLSILLIISNYIFKYIPKFIFVLLILIFVFSIFISIYHFGIEQGFFEESALCNLKSTSDIISKEELLIELSKKTVSCKDVTFKIFGLSLTSINIIINIIVIYLITRILVIYEKIR